ncbi:MAG: trypsin-like serine protease, partial [Bacteroidota bacterium]
MNRQTKIRQNDSNVSFSVAFIVIFFVLFTSGYTQKVVNIAKNFDTIVMPIPLWKPDNGLPYSVNEIQIFNMETKQVTKQTIDDELIKYLQSASSMTGKIGINQTEEPEPVLDNFNDLTLISNTSSYPWSAQCKIYIHWGTSVYVGSGVLIDSKHILTAGHCVYDQSMGWADWIEVVPGFNSPSLPFGNATSINIMSFSGWTTSGDYDYDMGVIELDRTVGALTGWLGFGYNTSNTFFSSNTFHNPGYPAESPYNGLYQYYWYGTYDDVLTEQLDFSKYCYGGQSGSGSYYIDGSNNRCVYAELSHYHGFPYYESSHIRITSGKYTTMLNYITGNTPTVYNLLPLSVVAAPQTIPQGTQLSSLAYYVHNYSSASYSGTKTVNVYLSSNNVISTGDILIGTHSFTATIGAKATISINGTSNLGTIPASTTPGSYFIGIIIDGHPSDGQDAYPVTVTCSNPTQPSVIFGSSSPCQGTSQTYSVTNISGVIYTWTVPSGWTINSGQGTSSITVTVGSNSGNVGVTPSNSCGNGSIRTQYVTVTLPLLVSVSIAPTLNPVCYGTMIACIATPTNGGSSPAYQWKKNGANVGTNSPNYTFTPVNNDAIICLLTSNLACITGNPATSNPVTIIVNPAQPVSVSIAASANSVCTGTSVIFTATPTNGGTSPS